jgi:nucleotide-binding universal stress UspA family protein
MTNDILFPFDFSAQGEQAAPFVRALADRLQARITMLSVVPPVFDAMPAGMGMRAGDDVRGWTDALQARVDQALVEEFAGLDVERVVDHGDPGFRIVDVAHQRGVDLIMMPTHGLGSFRSLLVGSATAKVLHDAECPVWTAAHTRQQRTGALPKRVLCAVDGGPASASLLQWAAGFSASVGAALTLLHVVRPISDWPSLGSEQALQDHVTQAACATVSSLQASTGVDAPLRVTVGEIVPSITGHAREEGADLIVIGRGVLPASLGRLRTHAYGIIQQAPCPVLSV